MRLVIPYTQLEDGVLDALGDHIADLRDVSGSITAYWELLAELWADGQDWAIVEQDIIINPDTLTSFEECPEEWCVSPYPYLSGPAHPGLGCARFRQSLMARLPDVMDTVATYNYAGHGPKHWCTLDDALRRTLQNLGVTVHLHDRVAHLHTQPTHGCCA
jgi:hypothetical protein